MTMPPDANACEPLADDPPSALEYRDLELRYLPCIDLRTGRVSSVEALLHWRDPAHGNAVPYDFLAQPEVAGGIDLGAWALRNACAQIAELQREAFPSLGLSVNCSRRQTLQHDFVDAVRTALDESGLPAAHLEIEVTEGALLDDGLHAREAMVALQWMGVRLVLDDFGTGHSSLSYLKRQAMDAVKIDRAFIADVTGNPNDHAIVKATLGMAKAIGIGTVAAGVETEGQLALLRRYGCDRAQGAYFSKALPIAELEAWLREQKSWIPDDQVHAHTLLVLDDEPNILSAIRRLLRKESYRVLTAGSAKEAFELLATNEVGVVISDQRMPEISGTEFLSRVKDLYPDTVRMVLSGYTELKSVTNAINRGAIYKFLTKPWDDEDLRATINEAFARLDMKLQNQRLHLEVAQANEALSRLNRDLEARVAERTEQITRDMNHLRIAQEVLENLPAAVIGVDESGMIAVANAAALELCKERALLGADARTVLPTALLTCINSQDDGDQKRQWVTDGVRYTAHCKAMGLMSAARGRLIIVMKGGE